ncbi:MAG: PHP domain-containing protein [Clostridia bacterium]|nr:PHP domain-containing protein [Clostridia bacterium]
MDGIYYDFHMHSCLSPCSSDDMTPNDLVGMAMLGGLNAIALTDHNSCRNVPAAAIAAERAGLIFVPGMELETSEAIHVVCLFREVAQAMAFSDEVYAALPPIKNRPEIYGNQLILNELDEEIGREEYLLVNSTAIGLYDVPPLCKQYGGIAILAHIDRHSNGVLGILGDITPDMGYHLAEVSQNASAADYAARFPFLHFISDSDSHDLLSIAEPSERNFLQGNFHSAADVVDSLEKLLFL